MKRLRLTALVLALALFAVALPESTSANMYGVDIYEKEKPVTVNTDGAYVPTDVDPYIDRGRTLMPLRFGAAAVGAEVTWQSQTKQAVIHKGSNKLVFGLNQKYFMKNGKRMALDVPLQMKKGRIMLPLRAFAEALEVEVEWDPATATVFITTGGPVAPSPDKSMFPRAMHWLIDKYYTATDDGNLAGSWWMTENNYGTDIYRCLFFYPMPDGDYRAIELYCSSVNDGRDNIMLGDLTPTTVGMGYVPAEKRGSMFYFSWPLLYYKTTAGDVLGDHYFNFYRDGDAVVLSPWVSDFINGFEVHDITRYHARF